jgi:hypothetical protein
LPVRILFFVESSSKSFSPHGSCRYYTSTFFNFFSCSLVLKLDDPLSNSVPFRCSLVKVSVVEVQFRLAENTPDFVLHRLCLCRSHKFYLSHPFRNSATEGPGLVCDTHYSATSDHQSVSGITLHPLPFSRLTTSKHPRRILLRYRNG